jgi:hypothetical protein
MPCEKERRDFYEVYINMVARLNGASQQPALTSKNVYVTESLTRVRNRTGADEEGEQIALARERLCNLFPLGCIKTIKVDEWLWWPKV